MPSKTRIQVKTDAIRIRQHRYGSVEDTCPCDICSWRPGTELHEIVSKGRVQGNETARRLSEDEAICSILCRNCHDNIAPTKRGRDLLIKKNIEIYGLSRVQEALYRIPEQFRRGIEID